MSLSDNEKLALKNLEEKGEIDSHFLQEVIHSGYTWALNVKYPGVLPSAKKPPMVTEVFNYLQMWSSMEKTYGKTSPEEKEYIRIHAAPSGESVRFMGFDSNKEKKYIDIASFFINQLDRFPEFKGRDLTSPVPTLSLYRRMYSTYQPISKTRIGEDLTVNNLTKILRTIVLPEKRDVTRIL